MGRLFYTGSTGVVGEASRDATFMGCHTILSYGISQKEICALTYFPNISKSNCNFCKRTFDLINQLQKIAEE